MQRAAHNLRVSVETRRSFTVSVAGTPDALPRRSCSCTCAEHERVPAAGASSKDESNDVEARAAREGEKAAGTMKEAVQEPIECRRARNVIPKKSI